MRSPLFPLRSEQLIMPGARAKRVGRMGKRIAFVGAGALGGYVGGYFAQAGEDVTLIDPWPEHIETIRRQGLELTGLTPEEHLIVKTPKTMHLTELHGLSKPKPIRTPVIPVKSFPT